MRKLLQIAIVSLLYLGLGYGGPAYAKDSFKVTTRYQAGTFLHQPVESLATNRLTVDIEQETVRKNGWTTKFGGRSRTEGAYAENPEIFSAAQAEKESSEFSIRDAYIQLVGNTAFLRIGYQTVVWGEAFGFFFADMINPKDLREATSGLGDLSDMRISIPMVNIQWRTSDTTVQAIVAAGEAYHKLPTRGGPYSAFTEDQQQSLDESVTQFNSEATGDAKGADCGIRISQNFGNLDLSLFGFDHRDRFLVWETELLSAAPLGLAIQTQQMRVFAWGMTATWSLNDHLFRTELIQYENRYFNADVVYPSRYVEANNLVFVLGWDLPSYDAWTVAFQFSQDKVNTEQKLLGRDLVDQMASVRLAREFQKSNSMELIHATSLMNGSSLSSLKYIWSSTSRLDFLFGLESFQGASDTQFGRIQEASRVMVGFKGVFDG